MQKINKPEVECEDPAVVQEPEACSEHVSHCWGTPGSQETCTCWPLLGIPRL